jgi:hypothetical protein
MRIDKTEALRLALALDVAISIMEDNGVIFPRGITKSLHQDSMIHLRELRSAALRANREAEPRSETGYDPEKVAARLGDTPR